MTKRQTCTCDACGTDLGVTGARPAYRLELTPVAIPTDSAGQQAILVHPPIEGEKDFCDLKCLHAWVCYIRGHL